MGRDATLTGYEGCMGATLMGHEEGRGASLVVSLKEYVTRQDEVHAHYFPKSTVRDT